MGAKDRRDGGRGPRVEEHKHPIKRENLSIKVFGSTKTNLEKFDVVQLKIQPCSSSNFKIIEAIVVPTICSPLSGQFTELAKNQYTHLNNIQLSDSNGNNSDSLLALYDRGSKAWEQGSSCYQNHLRVGFKWDISIVKL